MLTKIFIFLILLIPGLALANTVTMGESFCVNTPVHTVLNDILDYDNLHNFPGAKYDLPEIGTLLQMVKSQSRFTAKSDSATDAFVWLVLQPMNLADGTLYPRFLLHCASLWENEKNFSHVCSLVQDKEHFGLTNFVSHIHGETAGCPGGQSKVNYDLTLDASEQEVLAIKKAAVLKLGLLAPLAEHLFNEELFFKAYFKNLFNSWIHKTQ